MPINIDNLIRIIETIVTMIGNCPSRDPEAVTAEIRSPGRYTKHRVLRAARRDGIECTMAEVEEACSYGADLSDVEIQTMLADAWGMF